MKYALLSIVLIGFLSSCKKDKPESNFNPPTTTEPTATDKLKDTVLLYSRDIYLWYSQIPSTFNARTFADPDKIMKEIRKYSVETGFTQPVDRWSFAYKQTDWDNVSSGITEDFGLSVFFQEEGDLRVKYVEKSSPAGIAGIHRGWRITKINGNSNINTGNADFIVENVFNSSLSDFIFQKPDGTIVNIKLSAATYQEHPIFLDTIYDAGAKKVGYLVFNSFLGDTTEIYNEFQRIFNRFSQANVNEVVVDLRYNGGGYVSVQDKLANYLVNSSANGNIMMNQEFNDKYKQYNSTTYFQKAGSVNLNRVFFIVSNNTASASELLINNLKPYLDVKIVGPGNTYGKPVGYFPIGVGDWYIFPVSFRSTNKAGQGSYFNGLVADSQVGDGLDKDWGDRNETSLSSILKYINTGSFSLATGPLGSKADQGFKDEKVISGNKKLSESEFKGAIDVRGFQRK